MARLHGLNGIFHTKFADQGSIPAADLGYAALAQGLGMVAGEPGGYFHPLANAHAHSRHDAL